MTWYQATVGDACVATTQVDPARSGKPSFRYVDISGVDRDAKTISKADEIPSNEAPSRARKVIEFSDILVSTVRPNLNAVAFVPEELDGEIASTGFAVLRANKELLAPKFLYYWVQHTQFVDFLVANATGASYPAVSDGVIRRAPMPLPPLREQHRIIELLDEADNLRRLRRAANAKAARILPALFLKMFGDPATNPMGWAVLRLKDVASVIAGATPRTENPSYFGGDILWATPRDLSGLDDFIISDTTTKLTSEGFNSCSTVMLPAGSVLLSSRAPIGLAAINENPLCTNQGFKSLVPNERVNAWYLLGWAIMAKEYIQSKGRGATFTEVSKAIVENLTLPVPDRTRQDEFSRIMSAVRNIHVSARESSEKLACVWDVFLQKAFSGELTAKWRQAYMAELLVEMQQQAKAMNLPMPQGIN